MGGRQGVTKTVRMLLKAVSRFLGTVGVFADALRVVVKARRAYNYVGCCTGHDCLFKSYVGLKG